MFNLITSPERNLFSHREDEALSNQPKRRKSEQLTGLVKGLPEGLQPNILLLQGISLSDLFALTGDEVTGELSDKDLVESKPR